MIVSVYYIPKFLMEGVSYWKKRGNINQLHNFYWATVIVCGAINTLCYGIYYISKYSRNTSLYNINGWWIMPVIFLIEVIFIWMFINEFKIKHSICCCSNRYVLRGIHTLAICHILWFLHRVGCSMMVAIVFIALAPAQTLAILSLMYFALFCTVLYVAFNIHYIKMIRCCNQKSFTIGCKLFFLFSLYICILGCSFCVTLIFNDLANSGLTSSGLGSVILSLLAPTIVFVITLKIKQHLEKYFTSEPTASTENLISDGDVSVVEKTAATKEISVQVEETDIDLTSPVRNVK